MGKTKQERLADHFFKEGEELSKARIGRSRGIFARDLFKPLGYAKGLNQETVPNPEFRKILTKHFEKRVADTARRAGKIVEERGITGAMFITRTVEVLLDSADGRAIPTTDRRCKVILLPRNPEIFQALSVNDLGEIFQDLSNARQRSKRYAAAYSEVARLIGIVVRSALQTDFIQALYRDVERDPTLWETNEDGPASEDQEDPSG